MSAGARLTPGCVGLEAHDSIAIGGLKHPPMDEFRQWVAERPHGALGIEPMLAGSGVARVSRSAGHDRMNDPFHIPTDVQGAGILAGPRGGRPWVDIDRILRIADVEQAFHPISRPELKGVDVQAPVRLDLGCGDRASASARVNVGFASPADAAFLRDSEVPVAIAALEARVTSAAWRVRPGWYIVATADGAIDPSLLRRTAARIGAITTEVEGSHVVFLTQPKAVADVIEQAAQGAAGAR